MTGQNSYYIDNDGDGYGAGAEVMFCANTPPDGYSINNQDCDDMNSNLTIPRNPCSDSNEYTIGDYINDNCKCVFVKTIPTLSQWGIILLGLLLLCFGIITYHQKTIENLTLITTKKDDKKG